MFRRLSRHRWRSKRLRMRSRSPHRPRDGPCRLPDADDVEEMETSGASLDLTPRRVAEVSPFAEPEDGPPTVVPGSRRAAEIPRLEPVAEPASQPSPDEDDQPRPARALLDPDPEPLAGAARPSANGREHRPARAWVEPEPTPATPSPSVEPPAPAVPPPVQPSPVQPPAPQPSIAQPSIAQPPTPQPSIAQPPAAIDPPPAPAPAAAPSPPTPRQSPVLDVTAISAPAVPIPKPTAAVPAFESVPPPRAELRAAPSPRTESTGSWQPAVASRHPTPPPSPQPAPMAQQPAPMAQPVPIRPPSPTQAIRPAAIPQSAPSPVRRAPTPERWTVGHHVEPIIIDRLVKATTARSQYGISASWSSPAGSLDFSGPTEPARPRRFGSWSAWPPTTGTATFGGSPMRTCRAPGDRRLGSGCQLSSRTYRPQSSAGARGHGRHFRPRVDELLEKVGLARTAADPPDSTRSACGSGSPWPPHWSATRTT